jgi:hypothetical protein
MNWSANMYTNVILIEAGIACRDFPIRTLFMALYVLSTSVVQIFYISDIFRIFSQVHSSKLKYF